MHPLCNRDDHRLFIIFVYWVMSPLRDKNTFSWVNKNANNRCLRNITLDNAVMLLSLHLLQFLQYPFTVNHQYLHSSTSFQ